MILLCHLKSLYHIGISKVNFYTPTWKWTHQEITEGNIPRGGGLKRLFSCPVILFVVTICISLEYIQVTRKAADFITHDRKTTWRITHLKVFGFYLLFFSFTIFFVWDCLPLSLSQCLKGQQTTGLQGVQGTKGGKVMSTSLREKQRAPGQTKP